MSKNLIVVQFMKWLHIIEVNKNDTNIHDELDKGIRTRPQLYLKQNKNLRNSDDRRNSPPQGRAWQLVIQQQMVSPENIHIYINYALHIPIHCMYFEKYILEYTCKYIYVHTRKIPISEQKRSWTWKIARKGIWEGLKKKRERRTGVVKHYSQK